MRRAAIAAGALALAAGALGSACALIVGIPDRTLATPFCETVDAGYLLCDDFEAAELNPAWMVEAGPDDIVALDDTVSVPLPGQSLRMENPDVGATGVVHVERDFAAALCTLHLGFEVLADALPQDSNTYLFKLFVGSHNGVALYYTQGALKLQEINPGAAWGPDYVAPDGLHEGTWTRVEVDITCVDGGPSTAVITIAGVPPASSGLQPLTHPWAPGALKLLLGPEQNGAGAATVHYDNVVLYAQ